MSSKRYTDYTLDLETMGNTTTAAIMSIGAVAFNRNWEEWTEPNEEDAFYVNVSLQDCLNYGLTVDASTIEWWMKQGDSARESLFNPPPVPLKEAASLLRQWTKSIGGKTVPCWTHATFDAPILGHAMRQIGQNLNNITGFRYQRDIRTLNDLRPYEVTDRVGTHHNALDDAAYQAHYIWKLLRK